MVRECLVRDLTLGWMWCGFGGFLMLWLVFSRCVDLHTLVVWVYYLLPVMCFR